MEDSGTRPLAGRAVVVDDDESVRRFCRQVLELQRFEVTDFADGSELLTHLRSGPAPDIIVMDILMPTTGFSVLGELRRDPALKGIPIILITGLDDPQYKQTQGIAAYLVKPFTPQQLVAAVRNVRFGGRDSRPAR